MTAFVSYATNGCDALILILGRKQTTGVSRECCQHHVAFEAALFAVFAIFSNVLMYDRLPSDDEGKLTVTTSL